MSTAIADSAMVWREARRQGVGGSDVAAVFNEEHGCERRLFYEKRNTAPDYEIDLSTAKLFERGHELEDVVADYYSRETGRKVRRLSTRVSKEHSFMRVNIDRQITGDERGPGVLEIKTANQWVFRKIKKDGLPKSYLLQLQHALAVTGYGWGSFAVLHPDSWELIWFDYDRDAELIDIIQEKESEFWRKVINGPIPDALPLGDSRCASCLFRKTCRGQQLFEAMPKEAREGKCESDDSIAEVALDYKRAKQMQEEAEELTKAVRMKLETALGDRDAVEVPAIGLRILFKAQEGAKRVDSAALKQKFPEVYSQVTKQSAPSRPLRIFEF